MLCCDQVAFTARWVGGGDGCSHYNVSLTISTSLDGNTFDEEPAAVLGLHGALPSTLPLALALALALVLALALALPSPLPPLSPGADAANRRASLL